MFITELEVTALSKIPAPKSDVVTDIIFGKNKMHKGITEIERARIIQKTLGVRIAALYLKKRNWSIEASLFILLGK